MVDFTVAICTYNGAQRLPDVLERLRSQQGTEGFRWQIVVVDNNSSDDTAQVVRRYQQQWREAFPLRYLFEPRQGIAYARRRVINHCQSPWIGFLDDDNWPDPNWVAAAYEFGASNPRVGAWGGQIHPQYEVTPPAEFGPLACCLAVLENSDRPYRYAPHQWRFPAGAGMVVRRQAWLESVPEVPRLQGVCAQALDAKGEDLESLSYLSLAGWEIWHHPKMHITHQIPRHRLEPDYLLRLFRGIGLGRYPTRMMRYAPWRRPGMTAIHLVNDLRKLLAQSLRPVSEKKRLVADCQRQLLFYTAVSPFYHWQQRLRQQWRLGFKQSSLGSPVREL